MIVLLAIRIEEGLTRTAGVVARQVFLNGQFFSTYSAQDSFLVVLAYFPGGGRMIRIFRVAGVTGIVGITAFEFKSNDIQIGVVVRAACLVVDDRSFYKDAMNGSVMRKGVGSDCLAGCILF